MLRQSDIEKADTSAHGLNLRKNGDIIIYWSFVLSEISSGELSARSPLR